MLSAIDTQKAIELFQSMGNTNEIFPVATVLSPGTKGLGYIIIVNPTEHRTCDMVMMNFAYITPEQTQKFEEHRRTIDSKSLSGFTETENGLITVLAFYNDSI